MSTRGAVTEEATLAGWGIRHIIGPRLSLWWRPEAESYTDDISRAGLFDEKRALRQHGPRYTGAEAPRDEAIPPNVLLGLIDQEVDTARERLERLTWLQGRLRSVRGGVAP